MPRSARHLSRCLIGMVCLIPVLLHAAPECGDADALALLERMSRAGMSCIHPGHALLRLKQNDADACGVSAHYRLSLEKGERVAGRTTDRITAQPRDTYRYAHVFEIDRETAKLLKQTTLTGDGRLLEQFQYASLAREAGAGVDATGAFKSAESAAAESGEERQTAEPVAAPQPDGDGAIFQGGKPPSVVTRWQVDWLPAGFVATRDDSPGFRQTFTDGLSSFSVFLEPSTLSCSRARARCARAARWPIRAARAWLALRY